MADVEMSEAKYQEFSDTLHRGIVAIYEQGRAAFINKAECPEEHKALGVWDCGHDHAKRGIPSIYADEA